MSNVFNNAKRVLANDTLLTQPRCEVPITLTNDASNRGIGAVFEQLVDDRW